MQPFAAVWDASGESDEVTGLLDTAYPFTPGGHKPRLASGPRTRSLFSRSAHWAILGVCLLVLTSIIAAHAGLIGMGYWTADEYYQAAHHRDLGADYWLWHHIFGKSPRPVSEIILVAYFAAVNQLHRALITPFLAILWGAMIASTLLTLRVAPRPVVPYRLLLAVLMIAMFLVGPELSEVFFWPVGAAAYLTTLAATSFAFFLLVDGRTYTASGEILESACLAVAAACSEAGAMFVLALSLLRFLLAAWRTRCFSLGADRWSPSLLIRELACWSTPFAVSLFSIYFVFLYRVGDVELSPDAPYLHLPLPSLLAAIPQFLGEFVSLNGQFSASALLIGLLTKSVFVFGFRWCWQKANRVQIPVSALLLFALALIGTAYFMIAASYYQFGALCCERHITLRQCWFILALACFAVCWPGARVRRQFDWMMPIPILLTVLVPLAGRLPDLVHDYGLYPRAISARSATWQSGLTIGAPLMRLTPEPNRKIIHIMDLAPGHYVLTNDLHWSISSIMVFFHKQSIEVLPPDM